MESLEGLTNAVLHARLNSAKRNLLGEQRQSDRLSDDCRYWSTMYEGMHKLFVELAKNHTDDPMFKPTGRKFRNGQPELEYHKLLYKFVYDEARTRQVSKRTLEDLEKSLYSGKL